MAWTTPGTATAGEVLTAAFWNENVRDNLNELAPFFTSWTSYTPVLSNTWANGNATAVGQYLKIGKTVIVKGYIIIGSTTTKGASGAQISLPVNSVALPLGADEFAPSFNGIGLDSGVSAYALSFLRASVGTISPVAPNSAGTYVSNFASITATIPFTWGTGDSIQFFGIYEAAT